MKYVMRIILDILFPLTTHGKQLARTSPEDVVTLLRPTFINTHIALSLYEKPAIKAAVAACKFEKNLAAAQLLATLLSGWLSQNPQPGITILIPVPLSHKRKRERGFNQVARVLSYLPPTDSIKILPYLLTRSRHTKRQTSLSRKDRIQNMKEVFYAPPRQLGLIYWNNVTRVIICDDVLTTGATLTAAKTALAPHIPKQIEIITLAWAH